MLPNKIYFCFILAVTTSKWELFDQHEESDEEENQKYVKRAYTSGNLFDLLLVPFV